MMISSAIYFSFCFTVTLSLPLSSGKFPQLGIRTNVTFNRTITENQFDIKSYRSSWKFTDKNTIRVRFRLYESLLESIVVTRFLVRHVRTNLVRTYDQADENVNSTLTLYLRHMNHGRHMVCLLLYRSKLMRRPKYIFCQDIIYNFQKYGHHDTDVDEYGNTFLFLLTQYSIVLGMLCIFQLVYAARKRRFLPVVYHKANALRNLLSEHYRRTHGHRPSKDIDSSTHALEYLIYNLNRNALCNIDQMYRDAGNVSDDSTNDSPPPAYDKYLKIPRRVSRTSVTPYLRHRRLSVAIDPTEEIFDENDFDTGSYEDQSVSYKSVCHILEENKPWIAKLTDSGTIQHVIAPSSSESSTRIHRL